MKTIYCVTGQHFLLRVLVFLYRVKSFPYKMGVMFCLSVFFSILAMNMLAKAPVIFVPMAVLLVWR